MRLGFGFDLGGQGIGLTPSIPPHIASKWRIASLRAGEIAFGTSGTSNINIQRIASRVQDWLGEATYTNLRIMDAAFYVHATNEERAIGNALTVQRALEIDGQTQRTTYAGQNSGPINDDSILFGDDILPGDFGLESFAAQTEIWHRMHRDGAVGDKLPSLPAIGAGTPTGESTYRTDIATDNLTSIGPLPDDGSIRSAVDGNPALFIGLASNHGPTIGVCEDSRFYGFGGEDGPGTGSAGGPPRMALEQSLIPHFMVVRSSTQLTDMAVNDFTNFQKRLPFFAYVDHVLFNYRTNDINNGRTATQLITDLQAFVTKLKTVQPEISVHWTTIAPRTDNPNNTVEAPKTGFANSDSDGRKSFNDALKANFAAWGLADVVDVSAAVEDPLQTDRWKQADYTTDETHSSQSGQEVEAIVIKTWADALAVPAMT